MDLIYTLLGLLAGILTGITGMGATSIMTPFLVIFGVRPVVAVGANLVYSALTKFIGAWVHWHQGTVDRTVVRRLAWSSIPGGLLGPVVVVALVRAGFDPDEYVRRTMGIVLLVLASLFFLRGLGVRGLRRRVSPAMLQSFLPAWGALGGLAVGVTSIGSGSLITPYLMGAYPNTPATVIGTSLLHAAILTGVTGATYAGIGAVDWRIVGTLLLGAVPGVLLGSHVAPHLPVRAVRLGLAAALLVSGVKLI